MESLDIEFVIAAIGVVVAAFFGRWGWKKKKEKTLSPPVKPNEAVFDEAQKQLDHELTEIENTIANITNSSTPSEDAAHLLKNRSR